MAGAKDRMDNAQAECARPGNAHDGESRLYAPTRTWTADDLRGRYRYRGFLERTMLRFELKIVDDS